MLGHHIIRAYFDRVHKQVCKKVTLYLNKDMCAQGMGGPELGMVTSLHVMWPYVHSNVTSFRSLTYTFLYLFSNHTHM